MGNCCSAPQKEGQGQGLRPATRADRERRERTWQASGIISIRDQAYKELPEEAIASLKGARVLDAGGNQLQRVPPEVCAAVSLRRLVLSRNCLQALPQGIAALRYLRVLRLDGNCLASLPSLAGLKDLESLDVSRNQLSQLPDCFANMSHLRELDVSENALVKLPRSLTGCTGLEALRAGGNRLTELPEGLQALTSLQELSIENNALEALPPGLLEGCQALQTLHLEGNPITAKQLAQAPGYEAFEARRQKKFSKALGANVMGGGFKEAVPRDLSKRSLT